MHPRRILLAFSLAASAMSVAFADYQVLGANASDSDRLEDLSRTISKGAFTDPDELDLPATSQITISLREKTTELNNESLAKKYGQSTSSTAQNFVANNNPYASWLSQHPLPDMTRISSEFGMRTLLGSTRAHSGIDFAAPSGTPIYATGPGIVTKAGWGSGYGQYVEINHGNGYLTRYAHASRLVVRTGDKVSAGDHIANVGCTGRCTGPHLHFEVVRDGERKNPSAYLAMLPE